jgi:hypothetical protein
MTIAEPAPAPAPLRSTIPARLERLRWSPFQAMAANGGAEPDNIYGWTAVAAAGMGRVVVCGRASPTLTSAAAAAPNRPRATGPSR